MMGREIIVVADSSAASRADRLSHSPAEEYLASLSEGRTRDTMAAKLDKIAQLAGFTDWRSAPWTELTKDHVAAVLSGLVAEGHTSVYINTVLQGLRGVAKTAFLRGQITRASYDLVRRMRVNRGTAMAMGRYVTLGERNAIMRACLGDATAAGRRDAAITACGYPAGLRRAEIAALDVQDLTDDGRFVTVQIKGFRQRLVPVDNGGAQALRDWLAVRGDEAGPLFRPGNRGGYLERNKRISGQAIYEILKRRAQQAGVENVTIADLRRSVYTDLMTVADPATVAEYLGHRSATTAYSTDHRHETRKRDTAAHLQIAYVREAWGAASVDRSTP